MSEIIALLSEIIAPVIGGLLLALAGIFGGIEVAGAAGGTAVISIEIALFVITVNNGKK